MVGHEMITQMELGLKNLSRHEMGKHMENEAETEGLRDVLGLG